MDQDRWKAVNHIFHAALDLSPSERQEFVNKAADGDTALVEEVALLLKADENAGSYLESPIVDPSLLRSAVGAWVPELRPGDILCERFRIVRAVGEGGMGCVFEAFDIELGVQVALKAIRPEIASNPEALARFRQEVRLARRITSTNVCKTFDLERESRIIDVERGTRQEIVFLSMEFLQGETLAARIERVGALPLNEALDVARQVAVGLEAARALGVIHRDIKPANVMLVPVSGNKFRAVITDFGLAHVDGPDALRSLSGVSSKANPVGTLAYMAPEQLKGEKLSPETDVYAFGLLLFEMVTGGRAFPSETLLSGIARRLNGPPPEPRLVVPDLPEHWCGAINGCLRVDPFQRFASAADAVAVLDGARPPVRNRTAAWPAQLEWRGITAAIIIFFLTMAVFWGGLRLTWSKPDSGVAQGALVYLPPVRNETDEKAFDNITELIRAELAQSVQINLLDQGRVGDTLQRMTKAPDTVIDEPTAREIAMRTGAARVVFVRMTGAGDNYRLDVDLQQPDNTPTRYRKHWTKSFVWRSGSPNGSIPGELLAAVRDASDWIRREVGESQGDIARLDVPPGDATTDNWEALADFVEAQKLQVSNHTSEAVIALQDAVKHDPHFSLALGRLGDLLFSTGQYQDGYRAYEGALESEELRRLSRRERARILGEFALDTGDYAAAERAYRDLTVYYEDDYNGWSYRGFPLMMLGRTDEAITSLEKAYSLDTSRANAPWELARAHLLKGNVSEALQWATVLDKQGSPETSSYIRGAVQFLNHNFREADNSFNAMAASHNPIVVSWSYYLRARVAAELGDYPGAISMLDQGIEFNRQSGQVAFEADQLFARAYVEALFGNYAACLKDIQLAISLEDSPRRLTVASAVLGEAYSRAPHLYGAQLERELRKLEKRLPHGSLGVFAEIARYRLRGEVLFASGDAKGAVAEFGRASQLEAAANSREFLGRALSRASFQEKDSRTAQELRQAALDAYAVLALQPARLWLDSPDSLPGSYLLQLHAFIDLARGVPGYEKQLARALAEQQALEMAGNTRTRSLKE